MDKDFFVFPVGRKSKLTAIRSYRIRFFLYSISTLSLYKRRIVTNGISNIGINRCTISVHLPVGGNRNLFPAGNIITRFIEIHRTFRRLLHPVKLPVSIQQQITGRAGTLPRTGISGIRLHLFRIGERNKCSPAFFFIDCIDTFIFPVIMTRCFQGFRHYFQVRFPYLPLLVTFRSFRF